MENGKTISNKNPNSFAKIVLVTVITITVLFFGFVFWGIMSDGILGDDEVKKNNTSIPSSVQGTYSYVSGNNFNTQVMFGLKIESNTALLTYTYRDNSLRFNLDFSKNPSTYTIKDIELKSNGEVHFSLYSGNQKKESCYHTEFDTIICYHNDSRSTYNRHKG